MESLTLAVAAVVVIVAVTALASRTGVAAPLILVALGVAVSFLPFVPPVEVEPEIILAGVLPPLLYSAAVSLPAMEFRRDFTAIGGLSVLLVVITSLVLGWVFQALIPGLGFAGGVALGAILSPTDAVATAIVKRLHAPPRVVTVLEGEGLLNDASALVLLRSAVAATASAVSVWQVVGDFLWAVSVAVLCGLVVGWIGLRARRRVPGATLSTALSFVVPFVAYLPAEHLRASGLVAVVTAGLVTGVGSARYLSPQDRVSEHSNWQTVETLLEGAVFGLMGLELFGLVQDVRAEGDSLLAGAGLAALAAVTVLAVRGAYLAPLLWSLKRRARRGAARRDTVVRMQDQADQRVSPAARSDHARRTIVRRIADIDYLTARPLGPREGVLLVWSGMRGVVTLAAAQSLPAGFPHRSFVVLIAFGVAAGTLLVQGGTLPWVVRRLGLVGAGAGRSEDLTVLLEAARGAARDLLNDPALARPDGSAYDEGVLQRVREMVGREPATETEELPTEERRMQFRELRLRMIEAERSLLLAARSAGLYDSRQLKRVLDLLDADQIALELRS